jgi:hypothetical protein
MLIGQVALVVAAVFAGVAIYVSACEHPARLQLDDRAMLAQWKPSYKHGAAMQAPLSVIGTLFGLLAWWQDGNLLWLLGAVILILPFPFTLFAIMPTNNALLATSERDADEHTRALLVKWGHLHAVRTALGSLATIVYLLASLSRPS